MLTFMKACNKLESSYSDYKKTLKTSQTNPDSLQLRRELLISIGEVEIELRKVINEIAGAETILKETEDRISEISKSVQSRK